jgi:hypothetical protein
MMKGPGGRPTPPTGFQSANPLGAPLVKLRGGAYAAAAAPPQWTGRGTSLTRSLPGINSDSGATANNITGPSIVRRSTVSGRVAYRSNESPLTPPQTVPPIPSRRVWQPEKKGQAKTSLDLNKMKNIMRNTLGHDARINENNTMYVPTPVLPGSLQKRTDNVFSTQRS